VATPPTCACCGNQRRDTVTLLHRRDIAICDECLGWLNTRRAKRDQAQSGGWILVNTDPIFTVADVAGAADHYEKLGFEISHHDDSYAFAGRGRLTIHLAGAEGNDQGPGALYLHCDDADEVAQEWRTAGVEVQGPEDYDYGKREGSHTDPDGNLIRFGSPVRTRSGD
jgi:Glyoxalase/Bleomycin resistance protein/Dioxygenase superfamily